jgi:hypothetical protein
MYNTNLVVNYIIKDGDEGDTHYRKQILEFLNLEMYNDNVSEKIDVLYEKHKTNDIIKEIIPHVKTHLEQRWPFEMDGKTIFLFLFSFDYFYLFYPIISSLIELKEINKASVDELIIKIKSNIKTKK